MRYTVFVILLVFFPCCLEQVKEPSEKTQTKKENVLCPHCNIVLISIETTRADHLGLYGYGRETTPVIDSLGSVSTVYENAYAQAPWTRTSIASLMTSRYPRHHGVLDTSKESVLDESLITLPEVFKANGYATGAVVTHSNLKSEFGFNQGFDYFNERMLDWPAGNVLLESLQWVNKTREPFFLWIHLSDPHGHYTPPKPYEDLFSRHEEGLILPQNTHKNAVLKRIEAGNLSKKDIERMIGLYDSEIRYTDDSLGAFLVTLKQLGLGEDTIVVLTADHGEEFFDHGGFEHGHTLYR
ncbi:MAG: sulfatase-like hydrolase/transferase, partial [Candidatus Altiarchaeales archaeon]|nr:sulfatase-like hydrolase/transferase [Candidatus Altiarchaeales archaeon]